MLSPNPLQTTELCHYCGLILNFDDEDASENIHHDGIKFMCQDCYEVLEDMAAKRESEVF